MLLSLLLLISMPAMAGGVSPGGPLDAVVEALTTVEPSPPRLVYAKTDLWNTSLLVELTAGDAGEATFANGYWPVTVRVDKGTRYVLLGDFAAQLYDPAPAGLGQVRASGFVKITTLARFCDEATGDVASFEIPPLLWALPEFPLRGSAIQSDDEFQTTLTLFNEGTSRAVVTARVYDATGTLTGGEVVEIAAGSIAQHTLTTDVDIGSVELREEGTPGFGCVGCSTTEPVYGFATVSWRAGGSPRVVTFEPILPAPSVPDDDE